MSVLVGCSSAYVFSVVECEENISHLGAPIAPNCVPKKTSPVCSYVQRKSLP